MGRVFGISANRTFGFYSKLESYTAGGYDAVHWTTAGDRDSVITVTNFGYEADDVTVTLAYNGGSLDLPAFTLEPRASKTLSVRDYAGSLSAGTAEGGYRVEGKDRRKSRLLTKQHVISPSQQVAMPFYGTYVYVVALYMDNTNAVDLKKSETTDVTLWLQWSDYYQELCLWCDDSSSNSSIATIDGSGPLRTITGLSGGIAYMQASTWEIIDEFGNWDWIFSYPQKPIRVRVPHAVVEAGVIEEGAANYGEGGAAGWSKQAALVLVDNFGDAYEVGGITMADIITIQTPNPLDISGTSTGSDVTSSSGAWQDSYFVCSSQCPTTGFAHAIQTWKYNGIPLPTSNAITYGCSGITIQ